MNKTKMEIKIVIFKDLFWVLTFFKSLREKTMELENKLYFYSNKLYTAYFMIKVQGKPHYQ